MIYMRRHDSAVFKLKRTYENQILGKIYVLQREFYVLALSESLIERDYIVMGFIY